MAIIQESLDTKNGLRICQKNSYKFRTVMKRIPANTCPYPHCDCAVSFPEGYKPSLATECPGGSTAKMPATAYAARLARQRDALGLMLRKVLDAGPGATRAQAEAYSAAEDEALALLAEIFSDRKRRRPACYYDSANPKSEYSCKNSPCILCAGERPRQENNPIHNGRRKDASPKRVSGSSERASRAALIAGILWDQSGQGGVWFKTQNRRFQVAKAIADALARER